MTVVNGRQLRAARAILGWNSDKAANAARIHRNSITRTEGMGALPSNAWAARRMAEAYEAAGIGFGRDANGLSVSFNVQSA